MMRILIGVLLFATACNKPSEENCRKALQNMQVLLGTDNLNNAGFEGEVRRCKGGSTRKAVDCAIKATTLDELYACDFYKVPGEPAGSARPPATGSSSGTPATGSAGGSGSTAGGSATGSAAGSASGSGSSASGSASRSGSTATGSAASGAGSKSTATGSAASGSGSKSKSTGSSPAK